MKKDRILALADRLEKLDLPGAFSMGSWFEEIDDGERSTDAPVFAKDENVCGTSCCIAGWATVYFDPYTTRRMARGLKLEEIKEPKGYSLDAEKRGRLALGLTEEQAEALFYGDPFEPDDSRLTNTVAAQVLRHLAETGEVDWARFADPEGWRCGAYGAPIDEDEDE